MPGGIFGRVLDEARLRPGDHPRPRDRVEAVEHLDQGDLILGREEIDVGQEQGARGAKIDLTTGGGGNADVIVDVFGYYS